MNKNQFLKLPPVGGAQAGQKGRILGKLLILINLPKVRRFARCFSLDMRRVSAANLRQSSETISDRHERNSVTQD